MRLYRILISHFGRKQWHTLYQVWSMWHFSFHNLGRKEWFTVYPVSSQVWWRTLVQYTKESSISSRKCCNVGRNIRNIVIILKSPLIVQYIQNCHRKEADCHDSNKAQDRALDPTVPEYGSFSSVSFWRFVFWWRWWNASISSGFNWTKPGEVWHSDRVSLQLVNPVAEVVRQFA